MYKHLFNKLYCNKDNKYLVSTFCEQVGLIIRYIYYIIVTISITNIILS